jgi:hypothetical protein
VKNRLNDALRYFDLGYIPIPVNHDKRPLVEKWTELEDRQPSRDEIKSLFETFPGCNIGILTGKLLVLDLDDLNKALPFLDEFDFSGLKVPIASTPSGGQHWCFRNPLKLRNSQGTQTLKKRGLDIRGYGGQIVVEPSTNGNGSGWKWQVPLCRPEELPEPPEPLLSFLNKALSSSYSFSSYRDDHKADDHERPQMTTSDHKIFVEGSRNDHLFHTGTCLKNGGMEPQMLSQVLEILGQNCKPPLSEKEVSRIFESILARGERYERNLAQEVREWLEVTTGDHFMTTDVHRELQLTTRREKKTLTMILTRLCTEGVLEKYGGRAGQYRVINAEASEIDWLNAETEPLGLKWPLGEEQFVYTYPKSVSIIAGSPDGGKTAWLLNFIRLNMNRFPIHYFSSEMGGAELHKRLRLFDLPLNAWKFRALERATGFADVIRPDDINIIDYMEIHENHYLIGKWIKEVFDKLKKGIAIIAIQKKPGANMGVGGVTTLEKPRLYVTMEHGKARIEKAKNWTSQINPNGLECQFKLIKGCKFIVTEDWRKP